MLESGCGGHDSGRWTTLIFVGWLPPDITSSSCLALRAWVGLAEPGLSWCVRELSSLARHAMSPTHCAWVRGLAPGPHGGIAPREGWRTPAPLSALYPGRMASAHHLAGPPWVEAAIAALPHRFWLSLMRLMCGMLRHGAHKSDPPSSSSLRYNELSVVASSSIR